MGFFIKSPTQFNKTSTRSSVAPTRVEIGHRFEFWGQTYRVDSIQVSHDLNGQRNVTLELRGEEQK